MAKRILIVDDEELIIKTLSKLLERQKYEVLVAKSGQDALAIVEEEDFDLIIADVRMPGINGVETVRSIQDALEAKKRGKIPVIFITGYADDKIEEEAKTLMPVDYIYKPFDMHELLDRAKEAMR